MLNIGNFPVMTEFIKYMSKHMVQNKRKNKFNINLAKNDISQTRAKNNCNATIILSHRSYFLI